MKNAYIKFHSQKDSTLGFYELVTHSHVSRLSNDVFCVPWGSLPLLDAISVNYSFATEDDMENVQPIWNFAAAKK